MRERVEDLGRLLVLLDNMYEMEVFGKLGDRPKTAVDKFFQLDSSEQEDAIRSVAYGLESIREKVLECYEICKGEDYLNRNDE